MPSPKISIVVPVRDEALMLPKTVPALLAATKDMDARIVWVCNACQDNSAAVITRIAPHAEIIETEIAGKAHALQTGDEALRDIFPRIYMDADIWITKGSFQALIEPLFLDQADMTASRIICDTTHASAPARAVAEVWQDLPHARQNAFTGVIAVSSKGRARWGVFPQVLGDDIFMAGQIAPDRKRIVTSVISQTASPHDLRGWVQARRRWHLGEKEIAEYGIKVPRPTAQRLALLKKLVHPRTAFGAWLFVALRVLSRLPERSEPSFHWRPDRQYRVKAVGKAQTLPNRSPTPERS